MSSEQSNIRLAAKSLRVGYHSKKSATTVLEDLDIAIKAGEFICLLGPNGAGKSTLLRTLAGAQAPLGGTLELEGEFLTNITPRERARAISIVSADTFPSGLMDVYAFTALGRHPYSGWFGGLNTEDHRCIENALKATGADHLTSRQVTELSDGERQKVAIARALAQESRLMLLDEPTAFLDLPRRIELMRMLRDLSHQKGMSILLSTHDLDLALRFADCLWIISPTGKMLQGYPEALAFSGALGESFASEYIDWDKDTGSFRPHRHPKSFCSLHGTSAAALWTRRSLERHGIGIRENTEDAIFEIEILDLENAPIWKVRKGQEPEQTFQDLADLSTWLKEFSAKF